MSQNPEDKANKPSQNISSKPDDLVKGGAKDKAELTEAELKAVAGGAIYMQWDGIDGEVTTKEHEKWIELNSAQPKIK